MLKNDVASYLMNLQVAEIADENFNKNRTA